MPEINAAELQTAITKRREAIKRIQQPDGSWRMCFQGGLLSDCFFIMTFTAFDQHPRTIVKLAKAVKAKQSENGSWKNYPGETEGNLSATVLAYAALRMSGVYDKEEIFLKKAEKFIVTHGGISKAHFMVKWMLAANGCINWPAFIKFPMSALLVPPSFPINFFQFSSYARIHFIPMLIAWNKKYKHISKATISLHHLVYQDDWDEADMRGPFQTIVKEWKRLAALPAAMHRAGYRYAEKYILQRIEADGTLYSYASATYFMVYALSALNYDQRHPVIAQALQGIYQLLNEQCDAVHIENSTSTVWDTALLSYTLQEAGLSPNSDTIKNAERYLLAQQHTAKGDWQIHNPSVSPGGWGFSDLNTNNPDNDDTSAVLRALTRSSRHSSAVHNAWTKGTAYLLSMQNQDGGWAAFEKNTDWQLIGHLPIENAEDAAIDPSTPDLTGRTIEFFGKYANLKQDHPSMKRAIKWLFKHQELNGSWYGRWGVCYLYGTWAALTGLHAVGADMEAIQIKRAVNWLKAVQHHDGGWGESCRSSEVKTYVDLPMSTPVQTAWAVDALISAGELDSTEVQKGIAFLVQEKELPSSRHYPVGIGLPGQFYIHYHSYGYLFPLLALSHYTTAIQQKKLSE